MFPKNWSDNDRRPFSLPDQSQKSKIFSKMSPWITKQMEGQVGKIYTQEKMEYRKSGLRMVKQKSDGSHCHQ